MKLPQIRLDKFQLFTCFVLFWVGLGWLGLILTLLGVFYAAILSAYIFLAGIAMIYLISFNQEKVAINHRFFLVSLLALLAIFVFSYYTTPTIFSGRDQGSLSEAAIRLTQNHKLEFSSVASQEFFQIYGPGKALNFPGFNYTTSGNLITHFPLGYISWLAIFYAVFGMNGLVIANSLAFGIFLFAFYLTARYYLRSSSALMALLMILSSFAFSWFFKFTLSENLALMLVWFGIYEFILFTKNKQRFYLLSSFLTFGLLSFARVEALAFFAIIIAILLIKYRDWKYLFFVLIGKEILLALGGMAVLYIFNIAVDSQFYITLVKGMLKPFLSLGQSLAGGGNFMPTYVLQVFMIYALLGFLVFGLAGVISLLRQKKFELLFPFLIVLPAFFYLVQPSISSDHPWMLRRFIFAIIPVCILYTVWFFDRFFPKRIYFYIFSAALIFTNLLVSVPYLTFSPNKNLLPQVEKISNNFVDSDLVLIDRLATGDGWAMLTGPLSFLFDKQAVYFFNPQDLAKIDQSRFSKIYFIIPDDSLAFYKDSGILNKLTRVKDYSLKTNSLAPLGVTGNGSVPELTLPEKKEFTVQGAIYILNK